MGKYRNGMTSTQAESHAAVHYAAVFNNIQAERTRTAKPIHPLRMTGRSPSFLVILKKWKGGSTPLAQNLPSEFVNV